MPETFIGFYWTLPVRWAGFRQLPAEPGRKYWDCVEEAAAKSQTIRYQRERVRKWIEAEFGQHGQLSREFVFIETQPDRASASVHEVLDVVAPLCARKGVPNGPRLVYVDFAMKEAASSPNWRRHRELQLYIKRRGLDSEPISPDPVDMYDPRTKKIGSFDPITHFKAWRFTGATAKAERAEVIRPRLVALLREIPAGRGRFGAIAERLNAERVQTLTGCSWQADNVRTLCGRLGLDVKT